METEGKDKVMTLYVHVCSSIRIRSAELGSNLPHELIIFRYNLMIVSILRDLLCIVYIVFKT